MDQTHSVVPLRLAIAREFGSCGGKNARARIGPFNLNWSETIIFGWSERTEEKLPKTKYIAVEFLQVMFAWHRIVFHAGATSKRWLYPHL